MIIYKLTNLINGKIYVGQTIRTLDRRFKEHAEADSLIGCAIREFGIENFSSEILEICQTNSQLNEREIFWIEKLNCKAPNGYNVKNGGSYQKKRKKTSAKKLNLGTTLKQLRKKLNLNQEQVAKALNIPRTALVAIETNKRTVFADELKNFSELYNVSLDELMYGTSKPGNEKNISHFVEKFSILSTSAQNEILNFIDFKIHYQLDSISR